MITGRNGHTDENKKPWSINSLKGMRFLLNCSCYCVLTMSWFCRELLEMLIIMETEASYPKSSAYHNCAAT